ncbi:hypothetical protein GCM10010168_42240 [Actinoplanes ianthinogenes]|uniref:Uncharacterized protein n=1 Tax=Actinoplanes ianthinogenes TaxID=122358 RepID=A0ABN6CGI0_9ACTN|nr:hypothetical protein [Actinoplanes ianthinogenes]BCJ43466.1 hypothetical protein Aiant_41230 [Actinoplanes ianthinogenes]GGR19912.1 hypothetical protein GCM10010168_42240 [Actinoplanes ianthinogenes]
MTNDRTLDQALRHAAVPVDARAHRPAAQNLLDEILRSDPTVLAGPAAMSRPRRRPRLMLAGAALALAAAAVFTVTTVSTDRAYASWTTDPSPLPATDAQSIMSACLPSSGAAGARVAIGERRGEYAYVTVLTADGNVTCFRDHDGRVSETSVLAAPADAARLGAAGIDLYAWPQVHTDEGYARLMAGRLGSQVTAVEITVRPGVVVRATVTGGFFAAWYPEGLAESAENNTSLTLRLADGRTVAGLTARGLMEEPKLD